MEENDLFKDLIKRFETPAICSILGIGGGAGRIVNKMQRYELPDTELCVFGMNKREMGELSLVHKYLIGNEGLGSGKDRSFAESECSKSLLNLEKALTDKIASFFVVCLGGGTGEGCIKTFIQRAIDMKLKILIATLPHSSEGIEKREKALKLLKELEVSFDGIIIVDYDNLPCHTISGLFEEADRKVVEIMNTLVTLIVKPSRVCFDFNDIRSFLRYHSNTRFVDFYAITGSLDFLKDKLKDITKILPPNYHSLDDVSNMLLTLNFNRNTDDDILKNVFELINDCIMMKLSNNTRNLLTINDDATMPENVYRINIFMKCN